MKRIYAVPPGAAAVGNGCPAAHMIYRLGPGFHLYRAQTAVPCGPDDLMVIADTADFGFGSAAQAAAEILEERAARGFRGIVLSFDRTGEPLLRQLAAQLDRADAALYVPAAFRPYAPGAVILIPTALSAGSLEVQLAEAVRAFGPEHVALEIERVRADFLLPDRSGTGRELSAARLRALLSRARGRAFFSRELCTYYFTYKDGAETHLVLYDTPSSIREKLRTAERLGVERAFLYAPDAAEPPGSFPG